MTKKLNLKRLAKNMSLKDKMAIIFADRNSNAESFGMKRVLSPTEEIAIYKDIAKNNQWDEFQKINGLHKMANLALQEITIAFLNFVIARDRLSNVLGIIVYCNRVDKNFNKIIYDLMITYGVIKSKQNTKGFLKKWRSSYFHRSFNRHFNYLAPAKNNNPQELEPNIYLQAFFMEAFRKLKKLKIAFFLLDYIVKDMIGINYLSKRQKRKLARYDRETKSFLFLKNEFATLRIYKDSANKKLFRTTNLSTPEFLKTLKNLKKLALTTIGKETAGNMINNGLEKLRKS